MRVKICGITDIEIARLVTSLGADSLGFVFYPQSVRNITVEKTVAITSLLPPWISKTGVFVTQRPEDIINIVNECGIDTIQLHGAQDDGFIQHLRSLTTLPIIRAIGMEHLDVEACRRADIPEINALLVDAKDSREWGGTGKRVAIPDGFTQSEREFLRNRVIIAGGVNAGNVAEIIAKIDPYGLDLSSGVERKKGCKDSGLIKDFFNAYHKCL